ncbi:MAG: GIDE domain-containing protein [Terriglobales bacterium]
MSIIIGLVWLLVGAISRSQARLIESLPTTKCNLAKPGLVQVEGKAAGKDRISSIVFRFPCYICQAELMPKGRRAITRKQQSTRFKVQDGSGTVVVDPEGADFDLKRSVRVIVQEARILEHEGEGNPEDLARRLREYGYGTFRGIIHESNLRPNEPVLVIGTASEVPEAPQEPAHILIRKEGNGPLYIAESSRQGAVAESRKWAKIGLTTGLILIALGVLLVLSA